MNKLREHSQDKAAQMAQYILNSNENELAIIIAYAKSYNSTGNSWCIDMMEALIEEGLQKRRDYKKRPMTIDM